MFLATEDPPRVYYEFEVNPLGALFDARVDIPRADARATMRVDATWNCPGLEARVTAGRTAGRPSCTIPLEPVVRHAGADATRGQLLSDRPRRRFGTGRVHGVVADLRRSARLPRARTLRDPAATASGIVPRDPVLLEPLDRPLPRPALLELEEVRLLLRVSAAAPRGRRRRAPAPASALRRSRRQASSSQCAAKSSRSPRVRSPWSRGSARSADPRRARRGARRRARGPGRRRRSRGRRSA